MDKNTLRKVYLEKRKMLSEAEYERRNLLLTEQLKLFLLQNNFQNIHIFLPILKNKEPNTFPFIRYIWTYQPQIPIITSISDLKLPEMQHFSIDKSVSIKPNKWGIPEPQNAKLFPLEEITCVIVPMVVGSKTGHRIGYGKGYYDRFLSQCSAGTYFLGISLSPLLDGDLYANQYDLKMDAIMTPFQNLIF